MLRQHQAHLWWRSGGFAGLVVAFGLLAAACLGAGDSDSSISAPTGPWVTPTLAPDERMEDGVIITPNPERAISTFITIGWKTDFTRHTVPYNQISSGGPPKDGIPAIDKPKFISFEEADKFLEEDEPVMLVKIDGDARAYPLQILIWHEIVNDVVGGEPVVATFCPLCNTGLAFRRSLDGQVLDFGTTGNLRFSDLVMYDRQTETWWQQISGEGIIGTHAGRSLEFIPASIVSYSDFKASFPQGKVLSRDTGFVRSYGTNPYIGYDNIGASPFLYSGPRDGRLPAMMRVVAIDLNGESAAYPFSELAKDRVVNDEVGGQAIVVFFKPGTRSALDASAIASSREIGSGVVFSRVVDGQALTFRPREDRFADDQTGTVWEITGKAVQGPLSGKQLQPIVHGNHFWFSWAVFRPHTRVYAGDLRN